jgi:RNA polymerase sigma-70 factor, ECF subfamily
MSPTLERSIIRRAQRGDPKAIEALIRGHQEPLFAFMLRMTGKPDVAEDMVQEAFVRVLKNLDRFDNRFRFSTWLFTIAKRLYVNHMQKMRPSYDSDMVNGFHAAGSTPNLKSEHNETLENLRGVLEQVMDGLTGQQREIVLLYHQQSWSITEIALHLDMPEGTIKSHLHRARRRMRRQIDDDTLLRRRASEAFS